MLALCAWQGPAGSRDVAGNLTRAEEAIRAAAAAGADVLVFPELFLTGYAIGDDVRELAESADGPACRRLAAAVKAHGVAIVYGFPEQEVTTDGPRLYNSANFLTPEAGLLATYRKTHLFGDEEPMVFTAGEELKVVNWRGRRVGLLICYDVEFPETVRTLALRGAEVVLVPTANMAPYWAIPHVLLPARAAESAVPIVYANYCGAEGDLTYTGDSCILDELGRELARAGPGPALLTAKVAPASGPLARTLSTQRRDRRPELYADHIPVEEA